MRPLCYINPNKGGAREILGAFAKGSGADITADLSLKPGRPAVLYGVDAMTDPLWREIVAKRHPYYYIDNGYFGSKWQGGNYYRVTKDAPQQDGLTSRIDVTNLDDQTHKWLLGGSDGSRWRKLGKAIKPWRTDGTYILVAVQSDLWHHRHGHGGADRFADWVVAEIGKYTKRPVIVRGKPLKGHTEPPLLDHIRGAWAVVTHTSNVAVDALLEGVPCFTLGQCAAEAMGLSDLSQIESPVHPEREAWAAVLADNQWTLDELRDGTCWRALNP